MRTSSKARPNEDACTTSRPSTREFRAVWEWLAMTRSTSGCRARVTSAIRGEMVPKGKKSGGERPWGTFLEPALDAGGGAEPGDPVALRYRANRVKNPRTDCERPDRQH